MPVQIVDGMGRGYVAGVCSENRLRVTAVSQSIEAHTNQDEGQAYHLSFSQSPTANDDCILYIQNDDDDDLILEGFYLYVSAACEVYVKLGDTGTRNSATTLTPVNANAGSGNTATGTFEKGADLDGGSATLTGGSEFMRWIFTAASTTDFYNLECDCIIPENQTLTLWCDTSTVTVTGVAVFFYHGGC